MYITPCVIHRRHVGKKDATTLNKPSCCELLDLILQCIATGTFTGSTYSTRNIHNLQNSHRTYQIRMYLQSHVHRCCMDSSTTTQVDLNPILTHCLWNVWSRCAHMNGIIGGHVWIAFSAITHWIEEETTETHDNEKTAYKGQIKGAWADFGRNDSDRNWLVGPLMVRWVILKTGMPHFCQTRKSPFLP